jgi:hypothetical protein
MVGAEPASPDNDPNRSDPAGRCGLSLEARLLGFTRSGCLRGRERGLVLVRGIWRAEADLLPWEPRSEIPHRRVVPVSELGDHLWTGPGPSLTPRRPAAHCTPGPPSRRSSRPATPTRPWLSWNPRSGTTPTTSFPYQRIMRLQVAAGRLEAVRRTLSLLEARLADLGVTPGAQTRQAAASLLGTGPASHRPPAGPAPGPQQL